MDPMICGLEGVAAYLDDMIVTGRTYKEHHRNLEALFGRIHEYGFRVRMEKCNFLMPQIRYPGCIIDKNGRHPDPEKIELIRQMPVPRNVAEVCSFLGMISYYGSFVAEMRQLRTPLDALLKKNVPFKWNEDCKAAFTRAREVLASDLLLTHFHPSLEITVVADASDYGIGAVILHRMPDGTEKAICHASRSFTVAEKNYVQIEEEGLALIFAKTTEFGEADALLRLIPPKPAQTEDIVIARIEQDILAVQNAAVTALPVTRSAIEEESRKNEKILQVIAKQA
ncbi:hypothetical protein ANCDUO_23656 [Ancylostoma duodenale]|uniref:RNA-directed DNA polymerase n=1 Tax=Ancylostoma duodenale TaxID=51022 RepID=A0A0C2FHU0_9BILA|nr:hypothetical protein ANCDUO_23656 [Ancylostoma duodenale]